MNNTKKRSRRRLAGIVVAAAAVVAAVAVIALVAGGSSSEPSLADQTAMQTTIGSWLGTQAAALAPQNPGYTAYATDASVPQAVYEQVHTTYEASLQAVGTAEFISSQGQTDSSKAIAGMRSDGIVETQVQTRVLSLDYKRTLSNGDIVVWAKIWLGDVRQVYASGTVGVGPATTDYVDETPTYQYQMRNVAGHWRIVSQALVFLSEDTAPGASQFGPNTPHSFSSDSLVTGDEGLILDTPPPVPTST